MPNHNVNKCDLSGIVQYIQDMPGGKGKTIAISQMAAGRFETYYNIIVPTTLLANMDVNAGDEVLILNAICYSNENQIRFRISAEDQLIILDKSNRSLNQGTINAKDMFI